MKYTFRPFAWGEAFRGGVGPVRERAVRVGGGVLVGSLLEGKFVRDVGESWRKLFQVPGFLFPVADNSCWLLGAGSFKLGHGLPIVLQDATPRPIANS